MAAKRTGEGPNRGAPSERTRRSACFWPLGLPTLVALDLLTHYTGRCTHPGWRPVV